MYLETKKFANCFIEIFALLQLSGTESAMSFGMPVTFF